MPGPHSVLSITTDGIMVQWQVSNANQWSSGSTGSPKISSIYLERCAELKKHVKTAAAVVGHPPAEVLLAVAYIAALSYHAAVYLLFAVTLR